MLYVWMYSSQNYGTSSEKHESAKFTYMKITFVINSQAFPLQNLISLSIWPLDSWYRYKGRLHYFVKYRKTHRWLAICMCSCIAWNCCADESYIIVLKFSIMRSGATISFLFRTRFLDNESVSFSPSKAWVRYQRCCNVRTL